MTPAYPEASAKAPCTRITVGVVAMSHSFPCSIGTFSSVPLRSKDDIARSSDFRSSPPAVVGSLRAAFPFKMKPCRRETRLEGHNADRPPLRLEINGRFAHLGPSGQKAGHHENSVIG